MSRPLTSDVIAEGDRRAAALTRQHGTTYYWGTRLLRPEQRRDVFTVYALCRLADDTAHLQGDYDQDLLLLSSAR